jgi:hypothetical protein
MRKVILLVLFYLHSFAMAADNAPLDQADDALPSELEVLSQETESEVDQPTEEPEDLILAVAESTINAQESTGDAEESARDAEESAGEVEESADEESSSRFIPTEQISQDLGVSFPIDI